MQMKTKKTLSECNDTIHDESDGFFSVSADASVVQSSANRPLSQSINLTEAAHVSSSSRDATNTASQIIEMKLISALAFFISVFSWPFEFLSSK
jgi:hypothetical protein